MHRRDPRRRAATTRWRARDAYILPGKRAAVTGGLVSRASMRRLERLSRGRRHDDRPAGGVTNLVSASIAVHRRRRDCALARALRLASPTPAARQGRSQYDKLYTGVELLMALPDRLPRRSSLNDDPARPPQSSSSMAGDQCRLPHFSISSPSRIDASALVAPAGHRGADRAVRCRESLGHIHFSMVAIQNRSGINEALANMYPAPALTPAYPWIASDARSPVARRVVIRVTRVTWVGRCGHSSRALRHLARTGRQWRFSRARGRHGHVAAARASIASRLSVDRLGNEAARRL